MGLLQHNRLVPHPTVERNRRIAAEHEAGVSPAELAQKYGLTTSRISQIVHHPRTGLVMLRDVERDRSIVSDFAAGLTRKELAAKYGLSLSRVYKVLNRAHYPKGRF